MLTNLIFNAVDALPAPGGTITLRTRRGGGRTRARAAGGGRHGRGMSEETRRRCLEPFFTTKGTRARAWGWRWSTAPCSATAAASTCKAPPAQGTRFILRFPLRQPAAAVVVALDNAVDRNAHRILVVDDQAVLCEILVEYLTGDGHQVETALDGYEALEKFRAATARGDGFGLLITDRAMPGMSGEHLATGVKAMEPCTRIILLTGYAAMGSTDECPPCIDMVVDKPVTRDALRQAVVKVMADSPSPVGRRVLVDNEKMAAATAS